MEKMNSNELENELMEVTGGAAETDLVPIKEKSSELVPKPDYKTVECWFCKKSLNFLFYPFPPIKRVVFQRLDFRLDPQDLLKKLKNVNIIYVLNVLKNSTHTHTHDDSADNYDYKIIKDKSILQTN